MGCSKVHELRHLRLYPCRIARGASGGEILIFVGIDIVSIRSIKKIIERTNFLETESVLNSVFTKREIQYCSSSKTPSKHYAVRFAGKEAFLKALGTGLRKDFLFSDIEFRNHEDGDPHANCYRKIKKKLLKNGIKRINVSFSHSRENAVAIVILEK